MATHPASVGTVLTERRLEQVGESTAGIGDEWTERASRNPLLAAEGSPDRMNALWNRLDDGHDSDGPSARAPDENEEEDERTRLTHRCDDANAS